MQKIRIRRDLGIVFKSSRFWEAGHSNHWVESWCTCIAVCSLLLPAPQSPCNVLPIQEPVFLLTFPWCCQILVKRSNPLAGRFWFWPFCCWYWKFPASTTSFLFLPLLYFCLVDLGLKSLTVFLLRKRLEGGHCYIHLSQKYCFHDID